MTQPPRQSRPLPPPARRGEGPGLPTLPDGLKPRPATGNPTGKKKKLHIGPDEKLCQKCGALFRWEHPGAEHQGVPMTLKLLTPGQKCDCGYGAARAKSGKA